MLTNAITFTDFLLRRPLPPNLEIRISLELKLYLLLIIRIIIIGVHNFMKNSRLHIGISYRTVHRFEREDVASA